MGNLPAGDLELQAGRHHHDLDVCPLEEPGDRSTEGGATDDKDVLGQMRVEEGRGSEQEDPVRHGRIRAVSTEGFGDDRQALRSCPVEHEFRVRRVGQVAQDDQGAPGQAGKRSDAVGSASDGSAGGVATRSEERRSAEGGSIRATGSTVGGSGPTGTSGGANCTLRCTGPVDAEATTAVRTSPSAGPASAAARSHSPCTATPKIPGWIVVWFAPVPRRAAGDRR